MAYVVKRKSDLARGKSGKWTCYYIGIDGKKHSKAGFTDRAKSLELANHLEHRASQIREGKIDPAEESRREWIHIPLADHCRDYHGDLIAKGDTAKHANRTRNAILRLLEDAKVKGVAELASDRIRSALGRLTTKGQGPHGKVSDKPASARTKNAHLAAIKAFAKWMEACNRIETAPKGLMNLKPYGEKEDRKLVRRALSKEELDRLLAVAEQSPTIEAARGPRKEGRIEKNVLYVTGQERAAIYRLAMGTGFRAQEIRTLTPERFDLDNPKPTVTVLACYAKNGKEAAQPITRELADGLRPFLKDREPGKPVLNLPMRAARMLRADLIAAGISPVDNQGRVIDFHALRGSYITHLVKSGMNLKLVQALARHSTIVLTIDRYASLGGDDTRNALEAAMGDGRPDTKESQDVDG